MLIRGNIKEKGDVDMQIKKKDIEAMILESAKKEFIVHGYDASSMRTIAKRSHTSLGNIYHYFPNKRSILTRLVTPVIAQLQQTLMAHVHTQEKIVDGKDIARLIANIDVQASFFQTILLDEFVIFMKTQEIEYVDIRNQMIRIFGDHLAWHMHIDTHSPMVKTIVNMLIECALYLNQYDGSLQEKKEELQRMYRAVTYMVGDTSA